MRGCRDGGWRGAWFAAPVLAWFLAGCSPRSASPLTQEEAERAVAAHFDFDRYVTNEFIPKPGLPPPAPLSPPRPLRIGLQWLLSGDAAPWVVAQKKGFFADEGLEVTLEEGGPGRDVLARLAVGQIDLYVGYLEEALAMAGSPTGTDLRFICASMKGSGVGWIGLDRSIPNERRSDRRITAQDLRGKRVGVQPGSEFMLAYLCDQAGMRLSDLTVMNEGATPDGLMNGALDYFEGLRSDQPRLLERNGYHNWTFLSLADYGYITYMDVTAVTAGFYHREPRLLACYVAVLDRSIRFIAAQPREAAEIMVAAIPHDPGTVAEMESRIRRENALSFGDGSEPPLAMGRDRMRRLVTMLYRYHRIDLPGETDQPPPANSAESAKPGGD